MISFSVAFDENKGIGLNNMLPWHIKEDLKLFKQNTIYKTIIMGRTTYEGLPNKLKDREIVVVTRNKDYQTVDAIVVNDIDEFLNKHKDDEKEYVVCGGSKIYEQCDKYASKAYVSFVKGSPEVDTYFNNFDMNDWNIDFEEEYNDFIYRELTRK